MEISVPSESTIRKVYLPSCYEDVMDEIRTNLKDFRIWVGVDETTDAAGRYVANVLFAKLEGEKYNAPYLVTSTFLEKTDAAAIARLVNRTLQNFWSQFNESLLLLLLSDAAAYMIKAEKDLKVFYPSMIHITCFAHALHRVCEQVREMFKEVNDLISAVKKVFSKAPSCIKIWKEHCGFLPPDPVLTRWGTWIEAALFYASHFDVVKTILAELDPREAAAIEKGQSLMESDELQRDLAFISSNLAFLPSYLKQPEEPGLSLEESLRLFDGARVNIEEIAGERGELLKRKFNTVVARNPDLALLRKILGAMQGTANVPESVRVADILSYKFCPTASVDVERSFFRVQAGFDRTKTSID